VGLVDWGEVLEAFDAVCLEASFLLVEAAASDASSAAGLGDVSESLDEFEDAEAVFDEFLFCGGHVDVSFRMGRRLELRSCYAFAPFQPHLYTTFPLSRTKANRTTRALNCRSGTRCRARHVSCAGRVTNRKADRQTVGADREVRPSGRQPRRWQPARQPGLIIRVCGHGVDAASCFTASPAGRRRAWPFSCRCVHWCRAGRTVAPAPQAGAESVPSPDSLPHAGPRETSL